MNADYEKALEIASGAYTWRQICMALIERSEPKSLDFMKKCFPSVYDKWRDAKVGTDEN
ncbi:MAG: hypothetical protein KGL39_19900 [Patescibacteria group bacterium]|nr:hypothetical protein [Patescibacteria group bacterium]